MNRWWTYWYRKTELVINNKDLGKATPEIYPNKNEDDDNNDDDDDEKAEESKHSVKKEEESKHEEVEFEEYNFPQIQEYQDQNDNSPEGEVEYEEVDEDDYD